MDLITLVITLIVIGVLLYLMNTFLPMDGKIKQIYQYPGDYRRGAVDLESVHRLCAAHSSREVK